MPLNLDIDAAIIEVQQKSIQQVHRETAATWVSRAIASWRLMRTAAPPGRQLARRLEAEDYGQEALEHAALARDGGVTLAEVEAALEAELA